MGGYNDGSAKVMERYVALEQAATSTLAVVIAVVAVSLYLHVPGPFFAIGNLMGGVFVFLAWRVAMKGKMTAALSFSLLAITSSLVAISQDIQQSMPILICQGLGLFAAAFFTCILFARIKSKRAG